MNAESYLLRYFPDQSDKLMCRQRHFPNLEMLKKHIELNSHLKKFPIEIWEEFSRHNYKLCAWQVKKKTSHEVVFTNPYFN